MICFTDKQPTTNVQKKVKEMYKGVVWWNHAKVMYDN